MKIVVENANFLGNFRDRDEVDLALGEERKRSLGAAKHCSRVKESLIVASMREVLACDEAVHRQEPYFDQTSIFACDRT